MHRTRYTDFRTAPLPDIAFARGETPSELVGRGLGVGLLAVAAAAGPGPD